METDADPNAAQPKSRRRWYQYSLRTLLIVVTLAGCGFGWLGVKMREAREQRAAVDAIKKLGGYVVYDYESDSRGVRVPNATPPGPAWLRSILGDDCFRTVTEVNLNTDPADADLECLRGFTSRVALGLGGERVTDAALEHLKGMTRLEMLELDSTLVTDAGAAKLQMALPNCEIVRYR